MLTVKTGNYHDYRRCEMHTEEKNEKGDTTKSGSFGFEGSRMFEMMSTCCADKGGFSGCSTMMKGMMETMGSQPCCAPETESAEPDRRKK